MHGKDYVALAMRTNDDKAEMRLRNLMAFERFKIDVGGVLDGVLGLTGEAGEVSDIIKKWVFHEKPLDIEHFKKELGDVMWYIAMICYSMQFDLDEILQMNIDKLEARYPEGFNVERANNRAEGDV